MERKLARRIGRWSILLILVAVVLLIRLAEEIGQDERPEDRFVVARVIDGDTFVLQGGDRVRLLGIDTPEKDEPFYEEAKQELSHFALGKAVRLEYVKNRRDHYGRLLGYAYVDSLFVNKAILDNGLGYLYLFDDDDLTHQRSRELLQAQRGAMNRHLGIWSLQKMKEDHYIAKERSFRFHRPGCRAVAVLKEGHYRTFKDREEALWEGLSPCRICKP